MFFKSNRQRQAVMCQYTPQQKASKMSELKDRWNKRNNERYKRGEIDREKYLREQRALNDGSYDDFLIKESEFALEHDIDIKKD